MRKLRVQKVYWAGDHWVGDGEPEYYVDQTNTTLEVDLDTPQAVLIFW